MIHLSVSTFRRVGIELVFRLRLLVTKKIEFILEYTRELLLESRDNITLNVVQRRGGGQSRHHGASTGGGSRPVRVWDWPECKSTLIAIWRLMSPFSNCCGDWQVRWQQHLSHTTTEVRAPVWSRLRYKYIRVNTAARNLHQRENTRDTCWMSTSGRNGWNVQLILCNMNDFSYNPVQCPFCNKGHRDNYNLKQHVCPVLNMKYGMFEKKEVEAGGSLGNSLGVQGSRELALRKSLSISDGKSSLKSEIN